MPAQGFVRVARRLTHTCSGAGAARGRDQQARVSTRGAVVTSSRHSLRQSDDMTCDMGPDTPMGRSGRCCLRCHGGRYRCCSVRFGAKDSSTRSEPHGPRAGCLDRGRPIATWRMRSRDRRRTVWSRRAYPERMDCNSDAACCNGEANQLQRLGRPVRPSARAGALHMSHFAFLAPEWTDV